VTTTEERLSQSYAGVFGARVGFGHVPALVVVDFMRAYTTPGAPLFAPAVVDAVDATRPLLERVRSRGFLRVFTRVEYSRSGSEGGVFLRKVPALAALGPGAPLAAIVPELEPTRDEVVLVKAYASAFFATPLSSLLVAAGVDTVIVVGCSTSGCVRATVVDGLQHGFRMIVPAECVADRDPEPHRANLFDLDAKYGDVMPLAEVMEHL
jgi:maleamate amidohydrolase